MSFFDATTFLKVDISCLFSLIIRRFQAHSAFVVSSFDISFDFSCDIDLLDQNHVLIDKLDITQDKRIYLC